MLDFLQNERYSIYSILGKEVMSGVIYSKQISVESLQTGLYFLYVNDNNIKFIKN